jgi:hypothetical protein
LRFLSLVGQGVLPKWAMADKDTHSMEVCFFFSRFFLRLFIPFSTRSFPSGPSLCDDAG